MPESDHQTGIGKQTVAKICLEEACLVKVGVSQIYFPKISFTQINFSKIKIAEVDRLRFVLRAVLYIHVCYLKSK